MQGVKWIMGREMLLMFGLVGESRHPDAADSADFRERGGVAI